MTAIEIAVALAIAAVGVWMIGSALRTGVLKGENGDTVARAERPKRFWLELAGGVLIIAICLAMAASKADFL
jgi:hypothetical protein